MAEADFKLSAQLIGHEADVRAVKFPAPDLVLSASRDCTVRTWRRGDSSSPPLFYGALLSRGNEYVNSLAYFPPNTQHATGLVISGGKDTVIEVKSPGLSTNDNAERLLIGHSNNVCTIDVSPKGLYVVSGGWDGQARVWNLQKWDTEVMLGGHEGMAVWSVVAIDKTTVATACADKSIRVFDLTLQASAGEVMPRNSIYTPDVVRALCKVPANHPSGADIASASNDGIIRLWKLNGQQVSELHGHDSFIYSLACLPTGELVSSGEDRTVRIWKGSECVQTITHPAISVWTVAVNSETGDIVTGSSDGIARVFTRRPVAFADDGTLKAFEDSVKASSIPQQQFGGGINKEKLPGPEFLTTKSGTKEGQVQMIKEENGSVTAHTWSTGQQQWINVGTVVDVVGSTGKKIEYNGSSYDYVFDVDIEEGKPPLKLPYNLSENPYERATKFLGDNELPLTYLDQVANFITQSTQGAATIGSDGQKLDGSDVHGTGEPQLPKVIPQKEYLSISAAKFEAIFNKILTINKTMISAGRKDFALNPEDETMLQALREALETNKQYPEKSLDIIVRMITRWPYSDRLAGLDLLRCLATYPTLAEFKKSDGGSLVDLVMEASLPENQTPGENAVMMGVRTIANIFATANGRSLASSDADSVVSFLERVSGVAGNTAIGKFNRNMLIAVSTVVLNYFTLASREKSLAPKLCSRLMDIMIKTLDGQTDSEVLYRGLVAIGTMIHTVPEVGQGKNLVNVLNEAQGRASELRVKEAARECLKLTSS